MKIIPETCRVHYIRYTFFLVAVLTVLFWKKLHQLRLKSNALGKIATIQLLVLIINTFMLNIAYQSYYYTLLLK
jgi:hypothetical protein